jgi:hypothetical protein
VLKATCAFAQLVCILANLRTKHWPLLLFRKLQTRI